MKTTVCTLLFLVADDKILLGMKKRGLGSGYWNGAGGKVEKNETIEAAMVRESQEEIGITPITFTKVAENDFIMEPDDSTLEPWNMYVHAYIATEWSGELIETDELAPQWFSIRDIPYDKMWQDDTFWLPEVLAGNRVKTIFTFDHQNNLLTHNVTKVESF